MTRANLDSLVFGFGSVGIFEITAAGNVPIGYSEIVGSLNLPPSPEIVTTMGGAAQFPIAARKGRSTGEGSLTMREHPTWIDEAIFTAEVSKTVAAAAPGVGTVANLVGSSLSGLTVTAQSSVVERWNLVATATATAKIDVVLHGSGGVRKFTDVAITGDAFALGSTGVSIAHSTAAFTVGDSATCEILPAHGGGSVVKIPQVQKTGEYKIMAYSTRGGKDDVITLVSVERVVFSAALGALNDVETEGDFEVSFTALAPHGGGDVVKKEMIRNS